MLLLREAQLGYQGRDRDNTIGKLTLWWALIKKVAGNGNIFAGTTLVPTIGIATEQNSTAMHVVEGLMLAEYRLGVEKSPLARLLPALGSVKRTDG